MGEAMSRPLHPAFIRAYAPYVARARAGLGEDRFRQLWQEGRSLPREQALAEVEGLAQRQPDSAARPASSPRLPAGMTSREVTVLRLLAQGLNDRQIAGRLMLSKRTVHAHLRSIYGKLDVPNRSAATRKAIDLKII